MAKLWELKYHEDTTEKHQITAEEIQFLKDLQKEMNTQDHVGQADPRYWTIKTYDKEYGKEMDDNDGICVCYESDCDTIWEGEVNFWNIDETVEAILQAIDKQGIELNEEEVEYIKNSYDESSLIEALEDADFEIMKWRTKSTCTGMFLTHKAAQEHLQRNDYHYSDDAHTYAMTAWRSSEEMLWKILQTVDFDKLGKGE